ncbi:MAG: 50S ribosomal protein L11 methyltransferase [Chitinophagales bacterium]|nr:50S ribosomal protein L11 methyltransferase [Chitinophagales bacterium]
MSKYYKLVLPIEGEENQEHAIAILNFQSNFESVVQEDKQLIFSYDSRLQNKDDLKEILTEINLCDKYDIEDEPDINWNETYEKSFQPITILDNLWGVRASFHKPLPVENEIVIDPKMSFGTGHHETTKQMMEMMQKLDFSGKTVWDYGSGTGILAIMAEKMGVESVLGNDNEEWAYHNSIENASINQCSNLNFHHGTIEECELSGFLNPNDKFDIIIANITKNILLDSAFKINQYSHKNSHLLLSGFYSKDIQDIEKKYNQYQFALIESSIENDWACLYLVKR